jgi:peptidyl-prolyl cis-trans isomerase A (cyclophilin A)
MSTHTSVATIHTNKGDITVNLFGNHAPKTVANFEGLSTGSIEWEHPATGEKMVNTPLYNGVVFHRVINGFMIQGGDPLGQGIGGPGYNFDDEPHAELTFNEPYVLAMANAGVRGGKGTNGSQFFITVAPTQYLWGKHTVFGIVADDASKAVVDAIATTPTGAGDRPVEPVVIESIEIAAV